VALRVLGLLVIYLANYDAHDATLLHVSANLLKEIHKQIPSIKRLKFNDAFQKYSKQHEEIESGRTG
jgi:hypothetical protein